MKRKRKERIMTTAGMSRLLWFAVGQIVQLILHAVFKEWWGAQIPMCAAGGFVVFFFFFVGSWTTTRETGETHWEDLQ